MKRILSAEGRRAGDIGEAVGSLPEGEPPTLWLSLAFSKEEVNVGK